MPTTLAEVLAEDRIEFSELQADYSPVLNLVNVLLGVIPNCAPYMEIWPPGFRTYNLIVPNFLNLPQALIGVGAPKDIVGLAMYESSRAAGCMYCSAHACTFALRRGSSAETVTGETRNPDEAAVAAVAQALSTMPHHYTPELGRELQRHFSPTDTEWIVLGVGMMGFLNKFMDAVGIELEPGLVSEVSDLIGPTGWSIGRHGWDGLDDASVMEASGADANGGGPAPDSLSSLLKVARNAPGALRLERRWMAGLPRDPESLRRHIADTYGFDEPLLNVLGQMRTRRALAAVLRHNLDEAQSEVGLDLKALVGLVFARHARNPHLIDRSKELAARNGVAAETIETAAEFDPDSAETSADGLDDRTVAALTTALRMAPSPADVDETTIQAADEHLSSAETVEIAVWVSVLQLIHRLSVFFGLDGHHE